MPKKINISDKDVVLEGFSTWVTVGNVSVHIVNHKDEVHVSAYPAGYELSKPLGEFSVFQQDAKEIIDEEKKQDNN